MTISAGSISVALQASGYAQFSKVVASAAKDLTSVSEAAKSAHAQTVGINKMSAALTAAAGAAAGFAAIMQSFSLAQQAGESEAAIKTFKALGGSLADLRSATGGMISDTKLAQKANLAETMGIPADAFKVLAQVAQASAAKTGQSMDFMFDSIVTGTARQSKMILDNLGIMLNQEKAERNLAASKGKTVEMLSEQEKKQAFLNEVMAQGAVITKQVADAGVSLSNPYGRFTAALDNARDALGALVKMGFDVFLRAVSPALDMITSFKDGVEKLSPWVRTLLGGLLAAGGGMVAVTAALAAGGQAFAFLRTTVAAATETFMALKGAAITAAAPVLLWVAAIGAVVVGVAYLHKAWRENWGGIQDTTRKALAAVQSTTANAGQNMLAVFYYLKDGAIWALGKLAELGISLLLAPVRAVGAAVELLMGAFSGLFAMAGKAASSMGQENLAKQFSQAAKDMDKSVASIGESIDEVQGKLAFSVQVQAPTWKGAQTQAAAGLKAAGAWTADAAKSLKGALSTVWDKAKQVGGTVAEEWRRILQEIGFFSDDDVKRARTAGAAIGEEMSAALKKARQEWADLLTSLGKKESLAGMEGPQKELWSAAMSTAEELDQIAKKFRATKGTIDPAQLAAAQQMSVNAYEAQAASVISGSTSLDDLATNLRMASVATAAVGGSMNKVASQVRVGKMDLAGVLSGPVGQAADQVVKAFDIQLGPSDRKDIVGVIAQNLANLLKGGRLNLEQVGGALGQLIATQAPNIAKALGGLGGLGGQIGAALGGVTAALGPVGAAVGAALVAAVQTVGPILQEAAQTVADGIRFVMEEVPRAASDLANRVAGLIPEDRIQAAVAAAFNPAVIQAFWVPAVSLMAGSLVGLVALGDLFGKAMSTAAVMLGPFVGTVAAIGIALGQGLLAPALALAAGLTAAAVAALGFGFALSALVLGFLKLSMETKSFKAFGDAMRASVDRVVQALEPFWVHMSALAGLFDAFIDVVIPLAAAFAANETAARVLFYTLKGAAVALAGGVFAIAVFVKAVALGAEGLAMAGAAFARFPSTMFTLLGQFVRAFEGMINSFNSGSSTYNAAQKSSAAALLNSASSLVSSLVLVFSNYLPQEAKDAINRTAAALAAAAAAAAPPPARATQYSSGLAEVFDAAAAATQNTGLISAFEDLANQARAVQPDLEGMATAIRDLTGLSYEEALARAKALQAQKDATESLTNVPTGYKVALARFEAIDAAGAGAGASTSPSDLLNTVIGRLPGGGAQGAGAGGAAPGAVVNETGGWGVWQPPTVLGKATDGQPGSTTIVMENVTVVANNAEELMQSLEAATKRSAFVRTGSSNARPFRPFNGAGI